MKTSKTFASLLATSLVLSVPAPAAAQETAGLPGRRCGLADRALRSIPIAAPPSDCGYTSTNPTAAYAPTFIYDVPVVVHVIQSTGGTGFLSAAQVQGQIDVLNEDFRALPGSPGAPGVDTMIRFHLATEDPGGNPTSGITYSTNNTWFNDNGAYWNTLAWDTNRYLNIYTNKASGALGYVPDLPQGGLAGQKSDRVVVLWSAFGKNGAIGPPFDKGRTATHEVGHYLGLEHTFSGGCGSASACYTTGDLLCDTNPEASDTFGCPPSKSSCGSPDPIHNYMDYSDDLCMWEFTEEQARRMRCTMEFYRPNLPATVAPQALSGDVVSLSVGSGGSLALALDAGAAQAGARYLLLGSISGTSPGVPVGGFVLPLNQDAYFTLTANSPNQPPLAGSLAFLDGAGKSSASFTLPAGLGALLGLTVHHAYLAGDATFASIQMVSNAVAVQLVP
ncbi:MAG: zinc metalloprotease [Planctomycetota bacterium]